MKYYRVEIREVHVSHRIVEAENKDEAKEKAGDATEVYLEYSHTLDPDTWTMSETTKKEFEEANGVL